MRTDITYTVSPCSLGFVLLAAGDRGICHLRLGDSGRELRREFSSSLPEARGVEDHSDLEHQSEAVAREIDNWRGRGGAQRFELGLEGTPFQRRVWQGLCEIPFGETRTYAGLARTLDLPGGARAVAGACARNPVAVLVPCHRVLPQAGGIGGYRWGPWRKRRLLELEDSLNPSFYDLTYAPDHRAGYTEPDQLSTGSRGQNR